MPPPHIPKSCHLDGKHPDGGSQKLNAVPGGLDPLTVGCDLLTEGETDIAPLFLPNFCRGFPCPFFFSQNPEQRLAKHFLKVQQAADLLALTKTPTPPHSFTHWSSGTAWSRLKMGGRQSSGLKCTKNPSAHGTALPLTATMSQPGMNVSR